MLDPLAAAAGRAAGDGGAVLQEVARNGRPVEAKLSDVGHRPAVRVSMVHPGTSSSAQAFPRRAIAAFVLYALGLATPIFFQLVIDKVLVHESYATLTVLTIGIASRLCSMRSSRFLRRYLLLYATNKIDIRVATRTFGHLLSLPIALFEQASAGVLVKHMQQTSRIREFLTGRLFLTLLDGCRCWCSCRSCCSTASSSRSWCSASPLSSAS